MKYTTLCILEKDTHICLAMKKRGFGEGRLNGVGGKLQEGETIEQAVIRETFEEIGVTIHEDHLNKVAILDFSFINKPEWDQQTHVYFVSEWKGEPTESEEMKPEWHPKSSIPFHKMWEDDIHWLPKVLKGERVRGYFSFDENKMLRDGFRVETLVE